MGPRRPPRRAGRLLMDAESSAAPRQPSQRPWPHRVLLRGNLLSLPSLSTASPRPCVLCFSAGSCLFLYRLVLYLLIPLSLSAGSCLSTLLYRLVRYLPFLSLFAHSSVPLHRIFPILLTPSSSSFLPLAATLLLILSKRLIGPPLASLSLVSPCLLAPGSYLPSVSQLFWNTRIRV